MEFLGKNKKNRCASTALMDDGSARTKHTLTSRPFGTGAHRHWPHYATRSFITRRFLFDSRVGRGHLNRGGFTGEAENESSRSSASLDAASGRWRCAGPTETRAPFRFRVPRRPEGERRVRRAARDPLLHVETSATVRKFNVFVLKLVFSFKKSPR